MKGNIGKVIIGVSSHYFAFVLMIGLKSWRESEIKLNTLVESKSVQKLAAHAGDCSEVEKEGNRNDPSVIPAATPHQFETGNQ